MAPLSSASATSNSPPKNTSDQEGQLVSPALNALPVTTRDSKPEVILDTSPADLYAKEAQVDEKPIALVSCFWRSDMDYTKSLPKTAKYLYQRSSVPTRESECRVGLIHSLSQGPQRFNFIAGKMDTVIFQLENRVGFLEALETVNVLPPSQRPNFISALGIEDLVYKMRGSQFSLVVPHEMFPAKSELIPVDTHYELLSKRCLALGTTFFVHKSGAPAFLGACGQELSGTTGWAGARISYLEQDRLKRRLSPVVAQIGAFLHTKGYYGPVGADIIIDDSKASSPREWVIGLNVRQTGSTILPLLKGHFSDRRHLHEACTTPRFQFHFERESFCDYFSSEINSGRMIVATWFHDPTTGFSWGNLILGEEDGKKLATLMKRVQDITLS